MSLWRWVIIALLLVNGLLLLARLWVEPHKKADDLPPLPAAPGIGLVSETLPAARAGGECYTIGPLATVLQQRRAADRLRPVSASLRQRETNAERDRGWWVFLPPAASRQDALTWVRQLAERGVEDYHVVTTGEMENTVSLGLFEQHENAIERQARLRAMGFDAQLAIRREQAPQFWIDYRLAPGEAAPWRYILQASPGAWQLEIPCFN